MGVGVLIDAFLVRSLLVPALISLVGRLSGWPGRRLVRAAGDEATRRERAVTEGLASSGLADKQEES